MKKIIIGVLAGGLGVLLLIAAYPYSQEPIISPEPIIVKVPEQKKDVSDSLSYAKNSYMNECNSEGNIYNYCSCTFEYLDNTLTNTEFIKTNQEAENNTEVVPQVIWDAALSCAEYLE